MAGMEALQVGTQSVAPTYRADLANVMLPGAD